MWAARYASASPPGLAPPPWFPPPPEEVGLGGGRTEDDFGRTAVLVGAGGGLVRAEVVGATVALTKVVLGSEFDEETEDEEVEEVKVDLDEETEAAFLGGEAEIAGIEV